MVTTGKTEDRPFSQLWTLSDSYNALHHHTCMVMNHLEQKNLGPLKLEQINTFPHLADGLLGFTVQR